MDNDRSRQINDVQYVSSGPVVYWMSRDQRVRDNWALLYAQKEAVKRKVPLVVLFCFVPHFLKGTLRQYGFMLKGLSQVESGLKKRNIPFFFLSGEPKEAIPSFLRRVKASSLFVDFSPFQTKKRWLKDVSRKVSLPIFEVDSHNIVPCWRLFSAQAKSTESFRVKLRSALPSFLNAFPVVRKHPISFRGKIPAIDWKHIVDTLPLDCSVTEVSWVKSGETEAQKTFRKFLKQRIREYKSGKVQSGAREEWQWRLQPYLHFGQLSIQKVVWAVMHSEIDPRFKAMFLEALITRRELADHFCEFNPYYSSVRGFPKWAQETLDRHRDDMREHTYSKRMLEQCKTHDKLWNSIQREFALSGRIFGWARIYWAKRLLEWTRSPEEAIRIAITLTEKYGISGWDTSSYLNITRAIGGTYDTPSKTARPVFGKVPSINPDHRETRRDFRIYAGKS
ncbi:MAG: deoxyribodipyrimidine photo-lyase [Candidatus Moranbacteria bacterium]|nr:deoxyribodipyrimidine photo-lyase [Candidatus Moranbacteria bacterium]